MAVRIIAILAVTRVGGRGALPQARLRPQISRSISMRCVLAAAALVFASPAGACLLRSVDRSSYVGRNEAVLRTVPVPRGVHAVSTFSVGITSPDSCFGGENGPPYGAYVTWHTYRFPPSLTAGRVLAFYGRVLRRRWKLRGSDAGSATYRRGLAGLTVSASEHGLELNLDYLAHSARGH